MEQTNNILNPVQPKTWAETDNFEIKQNVVATKEGVVEEKTTFGDVESTVSDTVNMVLDESKTIAPQVVDAFENSAKRLNERERIVSFIPNDVLYFGLVGLGLYVIVKKVL